jgi:hypothetical protein
VQAHLEKKYVMDWKEFFKPDWKKVLLFLLFVLITSFVFQNQMIGGNVSERHYSMLPYPVIIGHAEGTIMHKIVTCGIPIAPPNCISESSFRIDYFGLAINLIFWYLISCLVVFAYNKYKK